MEDTTTTNTTTGYSLTYEGNGSDFFGIIIVNWLLTALTLGLYYPWAKARKLQYIYGTTLLNNSNLTFHGTGKEMFKGFIKAVIVFIIIYAIFFFLLWMKMPVISILFLYLGILCLVPLAIHGSYKYRMSRTSWRGIRFGYRGDRNELFGLFFKWLFFTVITLGLYGAWLSMNLRNYVLSKVRFGNLEFKYNGNGGDYFILNLKGYFLTFITIGIYSFWWYKELFDYYVNHLTLHDNEKTIRFRSTATGGGIFVLLFTNLLILVFTLGIGYSWVATRSLKYIFGHIEMQGDVDIESLAQTETNYTDATGEDISDLLDFGFVI